MQKVLEKNSTSLDFDNNILDEENPTSIAKKFLGAIEECKSPIKSIDKVTDLDTQLFKEIHTYINGHYNLLVSITA